MTTGCLDSTSAAFASASFPSQVQVAGTGMTV